MLVSVQISALDGILDVRDPHVWAIRDGRLVGSLKVLVRPDAPEQAVLERVRSKVLQRGRAGRGAVARPADGVSHSSAPACSRGCSLRDWSPI